jgi:hypothetical protein
MSVAMDLGVADTVLDYGDPERCCTVRQHR